MQELIDYLLKLLVDFPDRLKISKTELSNVTIFEITADPTDIGKIIGKQGRVIKAIRVIANAVAIKKRSKVIIQLIDDSRF